MSDFTLHPTCPPYAMGMDGTDRLKWSGRGPPQEIGSIVYIKVNAIGLAKVVGYGSMDGWLGLMTVPLDPPKWWIAQNGPPNEARPALAFGAEVSTP